ncbi:hypothetical protein KEJ14_06835 [Candidatus Bathyarchaeota archaeon]|nr:hypothetical protein [Candidatus Bathyarchaeota archaeon]
MEKTLCENTVDVWFWLNSSIIHVQSVVFISNGGTCRRVNRLPKPEAYYFPPQLNVIEGKFP